MLSRGYYDRVDFYNSSETTLRACGFTHLVLLLFVLEPAGLSYRKELSVLTSVSVVGDVSANWEMLILAARSDIVVIANENTTQQISLPFSSRMHQVGNIEIESDMQMQQIDH